MLTSDALLSIGAELKKSRPSLEPGQVFPAVASRGDMLDFVSTSLFLHDAEEVHYMSAHLHGQRDYEALEKERMNLCSAEGIERQTRKR